MKSRVSIAILITLALGLQSAGIRPNARPVWAAMAGAGSGEEIRPLITTSELVAGSNRFAFGLMKNGKLVDDADVLVRLYEMDGEHAKFASELEARFKPIGRPNGKTEVHRHADGTTHMHGADHGVRGIYVSQLTFPNAGVWGIELSVRRDFTRQETVKLSVNVLPRAETPAVGEAAPRSRNKVASDVENLREIDTSPRPDPRLHQVRIADAIRQNKAQVIVFATPQFCTSRICGPVVDVVRRLIPKYENRIAFIHQEIWQDFAAQKLFPTVREWRLDSEPWVFLVDGNGVIRAKFEGLVTEEELTTEIDRLLAVPVR